MKHHNQRVSLGVKGLLGLHFSIVVHHWSKPGQELKQERILDTEAGVYTEAVEENKLLTHFPWLAQPIFLQDPELVAKECYHQPWGETFPTDH